MKKSIFSKLMACFVVLSCAFVVSACSVFQKEDTNIKSIVIDQDNIPEAIVVGQFDNAGIEALVTYEDNSQETIAITTAMIPEQYRDLLDTPGIYKISIMFRNATAELEVRMVNSLNLYQVNFYDNKNQLITTQFVYDGEDATLPSDVMSSVEGYALVGWDRSHENISEDTNIYGLYVNIENTLSDAKMQQVLLNAEQYYITNSHFTSVEDVLKQGEEYDIRKGSINYHYDIENKIATSQGVLNDGISIFSETFYEFFYQSSAESYDYIKMTYEELKAELKYDAELDGEQPLTDEEFEQMVLMGALYAGGGEFTLDQYSIKELLNMGEVEFSYEITSNKLIYTCTITIQGESWGDNQSEENIYTIKYDDEKVLQIIDKYIQYHADEELYSVATTYNIDYIEIEFEDLIPDFGDVYADNTIDTADTGLIQQYLVGKVELTEEQLIVADVNLDGEVTNYDVDLIRAYLVKNIPYLPFTNETVIELFENAMQKDLSSDVTLTMVGCWEDDQTEPTTTVGQIDRDNKITKSTVTGAEEIAYIWESEGAIYEAFGDGNSFDCEIETGLTFEQYMGAESVYMFVGYQMIYGGSYDGTDYEFVGIEIVDGNFVMTINASRADYPEISGTIKYTFNRYHIVSVESTYDFIGTYTYDYSDITLELPEDVKALEDSAVEY
jgi:hypothetical protein